MTKKKRELTKKEQKRLLEIKQEQNLKTKEYEELKRISKEYNVLKKPKRVDAKTWAKRQERRTRQEEKFTHTKDMTKKSIYFDTIYELYSILGSQSAVAKELGVHPSTISRHLRGKSGKGGVRNIELENKIEKKEKLFLKVLPRANLYYYQYAIKIFDRGINQIRWIRTEITSRENVEHEKKVLIHRLLHERRDTKINDLNDILGQRLVVIRSGI